MKFKLNKEEKFIISIVIIVMAFLFIREQFLKHEGEQVEMAYEAGYQSAIEDVINNTKVSSTYEKDDNCYIILELPDGNEHIFVSPAAKG